MATLIEGPPVSSLEYEPEPTSLPGQPEIDEEQSEQALRIANFVQKKFREYEKCRDEREKKWKRYYRMYRGRQWDALGIRPNKNKTRAVINYIFSSIETSVPLETDGKYKLQFQPRELKSDINIPVTIDQIPQLQEIEKHDLALAKSMDQISDYRWRAIEMDGKLPIASRIAKIYGTAFFYTFWNPALRGGVGDIDTKVVEPFHVYPDPLAKRVNECAAYVYAMVVPIDEAKRMYPKKALLLKPTQDIPGIFDNRLEANPNGQDRTALKEAVMILEYWVRDAVTIDSEEIVEEAEVGPDGAVVKEAVKQTIKKLKYPHGRVITVAGDVLLDDKPSPYAEWPLDALYDYDIGEFWGVGECENLEQPQILYNKVFSQLYDNIRIMGNPHVVADKTAGVDWANYDNRVGKIVEKEAGTEVKMQDPPQFSPALPEFLKIVQFSMDTISGIHDITQGRQPVGVTAAQAIELLQQSAQTRIRLKIRNLLQSIKGIGKKWFCLVKQYYNEPRMIRIVGPDGHSGWLALQGEEFKDADLDLLVETDSSFIVSKAGRFEQGLTLLKAGSIQPMDLLKVTDWPEKEKILERFAMQEQAQAQAAQAQGGVAPSNPQQVQAVVNKMVASGASDDEIRRQLVQAPPNQEPPNA